MKKTTLLVLIASVLLLGCKKPSRPDAGQLLLVGDLTLSAGSGFEYYGNQVRNGLQMWEDSLKTINARFVFEDNMGTTAQTGLVFNKYAGRPNVPVILTNNSPLSASVRDFAEKKGVVQIALVAGDLDFCDGYKWVFRDAIMQDQEGDALAAVIRARPDIKHIALCGVNDAYGLDGMAELKRALDGSGVEIQQELKYDKGNYDFKFIINRLLSGSPDAIYFAGREQYTIAFINQLRERNKTVPVFTCDAFESPTILQGLGDKAKGVIYASYLNEFDSPEAQAFLADYRSRYQEDPGIYAIDAYVCGQYLYRLIASGCTTAAKLADALSVMTINSAVKGHLVVDNHSIISHVAAFYINEAGEKAVILP